MIYAFIYFNHTVKPGSSRSRTDRIAITLDPAYQELRFYDMCSQRENGLFFCYRHERFNELMEILDSWDARGIESSVKHRYYDPIVWAKHKTHIFSEDGDVHWQVLIGNDDWTCTVYVHLDPYFPKELWNIYKIAEKMNPNE